MRRRLWRIFKWTAVVLLVLLAVVVGLTAWIAGTRSGTAFAWHQVQGLIPASVHIDRVQGRLIGPLTVNGVSVDNASTKLTINKFKLQWDVSALLYARIHVQRVAVGGVDYTAKPVETQSQNTGEPFQLPQSVSLPVSVQVDEIAVENVAVHSTPDAKPFRVAKMRVTDTALRASEWRVGELRGHGPLFNIHAQAKVEPRNGYPIQLQAQARLKPDSVAPIEARATVDGTVDDLGIDARVAKPYNVKLNGHVKKALQKPELALTLSLDQLSAHAIRPSLPKLTVNAQADLNGAIDDLTIDLGSNVASPTYGKARAKGRIHYAPSAVAIQHLTVSSPDTDGQLTGHGQLALGDQQSMNFKLGWSNLQWPLKGPATYHSSEGQIRLTGSADDYSLEGHLGWQIVGQAEGQLQLAGSGSQSQFKLSKLHVTGGAGQLDGHSKVRWAPSLQASATLQGHDIQPGQVSDSVSGRFDFDLDATANQNSKGLSATLETLTADGQLNQKPLELDARATYAGASRSVDVDHFHLGLGSTQTRLSGHFGWAEDARLDGRLRIKAPELADLWPTLGGSLDAKAQVNGTRDQPAIDADIEAHDLAYENYRVGQTTVRADVDWSGDTQSSVDWDVQDVDATDQHVDKLTLDLDGTPAAHDLHVSFKGAGATLETALTGHYQRQKRAERFKMTRLTADHEEFAPWHLADPARGYVSATEQQLADACLISDQARVCLEGERSANSGSRAHVTLKNLAFGYAKPALPDDMSVNGALSGTIKARQPATGTPEVSAQLTTSSGQVQVANADDKTVQLLALKPGRIKASLEDRQIDAQVDLPFDTGGIHADATVAGGSAGLLQRDLNGRLRFRIDDLGFISQFSPQVGDVDARARADLQLRGQIEAPRIRGRLRLDAPKLVLVQPGLTLKNTELTAVGQGNRVTIDGQVESGGGTLRLGGQVGLAASDQSVQMTIQGDDFEAINIPQVRAFISPDLKLAVTPERIKVRGRVTIPKARITPKNLPASGATTVVADQVIVGKKQSTAKTVARVVDADIELVLGDDIHIKGFGLKTDATGRLNVVQKPGQPATGSGRIDLEDGSYRAYGQNLDITRGQVLFGGGPLSAPTLNVKAARYPQEDITVGVHVRGPVKHPQVELFSKPSMTQSEQLSWLLLGRAPHENSAGQSNRIAKAALALSSGRANSVLHKLGDKLGVDQIGVGSAAGHSSSQAAFTVGKYLTPKLYLGYGIGLFNPVSTVSLKYMLNSNWTLKTESSAEATGGDIVFSIDQ